jgi:hypothetical protein
MFSLRNAVIALVASAGLVVVLAGVSTGVFTAQPAQPPVGQSASVQQDAAAAARAARVPPGIAAPAPAAPAPAPAAPAPAEPAPAAPVHHDVAAPAPAAVRAQPVIHYRQVQMPVQQQPAPAVNPAGSVAPVQDPRPASPPPSAALPARDAKSRTVNTEPCACNGTMRKVSTHWDPPRG